ncbi:MAG TPA: P1 family peptidase [Trueperaceae bacterium]|nr:P1 family peptidase [Trueperaceae bacterium]
MGSASDSSERPRPTNDSLTAVAGLRVGHATDLEAATGCTVVVCPEGGCVASGLVLGPAPGSRETALLAPEKSVQRIDAVLLTGGSAFGLAAADGVVRWLEAQGRGYPTPFGRVPIVPAAALFDLGVGSARVRPDAGMGLAAAEAAASGPVPEGRVGAGAGATVGKLAGPERMVASGLGSAAMTLAGATVGAVAISNAVGSIVDPESGELVAGPAEALTSAAVALAVDPFAGNTTLVVVGTDAPLGKAEALALAHSAHMGIARVTRPSHTLHDGDSTFVVSTGAGPAVALAALSIAVQQVVARALVRGVRAAAA